MSKVIQLLPARIGAYVFLMLWALFLLHLLCASRAADYREKRSADIAELTRSTAYMTYEGCMDLRDPDEKVDCLLDIYDANIRALEAMNEATR